jgi:glycosyltransferase involved in cell wall biosynthesis
MKLASVSIHGYPNKKNRIKLIFTHEQAKAFKEAGIDVDVYDLGYRDISHDQTFFEVYDGIPVHRMNPPKITNLKSVLAVLLRPSRIISIFKTKIYLRRQFTTKNYDFILFNFVLPEYSIYFSDITITRPATGFTAHGAEVMSPYCGKYNRYLKKRLLKKVQFIFPVSDYTKELVNAMVDHRAMHKPKVLVNGNGVDDSKFLLAKSRGKTACRLDLGLDAETFIILTVCDLLERKGVDMLIRGIAQFKKDAHTSVLHIVVGEGPEKEQLSNLVSMLGLSDSVKFIGQIKSDKELAKYFVSADVYSMLSKTIHSECATEGFGISYIEASHIGIPVIGGSHGGTNSAIMDEFTGFLIDPLDPDCVDKVAEKLSILHTNLDEYHRIARNGELMVNKKYLWSHHADRFLNYIKEREIENV